MRRAESDMIEISLGNIGSEDQAKRIQNALEGKTYFNFHVDYAACANNWPVTVWTDYPNAKLRHVRRMILFMLACAV